MALDLSVLLSSVGTITSLMEGSVKLVQTIRSGLVARNDEVKKQLTTSLTELKQNLEHARELARMAEVYSRTHENILELLWLCRRAERFLRDNLDDCRNRTCANYTGNWKVLDVIFETIDSNRDSPRKVVMDRAEWYDKDDKAQVELLLHQFTSHYDQASACVRNKVADDLLHELRDMTSPLQDAETLLRTTVYEKILMALQKMSP